MDKPYLLPFMYISVCVHMLHVIPILDAGGMGAIFLGIFFRNKNICLLASTKQMLFSTFSKLGVIVALNKGLHKACVYIIHTHIQTHTHTHCTVTLRHYPINARSFNKKL